MKEKIKLIIWDLDNTLINSKDVFRVSREASLNYLGIPKHQVSEYIKIWDRLLWYFDENDYAGVLQAIIYECKPQHLSKINIDSAVRIGMDIWDNGVPVFPDLIQLLEMLQSQNIQLAIATNGSYDFQWFKIKQAGLDEFIAPENVYIGNKKNLARKPNPEIIQNCLQNLKILPIYAIVIGDRVTDIIAANLAGTNSILIYDHEVDYKSPPNIGMLKLETPTYIVSNHEHLLTLINQVVRLGSDY